MRDRMHSQQRHAATCAPTHERARSRRPRAQARRCVAREPRRAGRACSPRTVARYLLTVPPQVTRELRRWRAGARRDPRPDASRATRCGALRKRGNIEGAALFAMLAPGRWRRQSRPRARRLPDRLQLPRRSLRAAERGPTSPTPTSCTRRCSSRCIPTRRARRLLRAQPAARRRRLPRTRSSTRAAPRSPTLPSLRRASRRRCVRGGRADRRLPERSTSPSRRAATTALERWARERHARGQRAAPGGRPRRRPAAPLAVHALIAAAADPAPDAAEARAIDGAYFPWVGALHSLLDSLVDREEDARARAAQPARLLRAPRRTPRSARRARRRAPQRDRAPARSAPAHRVILTAMCSYYLSAPQCHTRRGARDRAARSRDALGRAAARRDRGVPRAAAPSAP